MDQSEIVRTLLSQVVVDCYSQGTVESIRLDIQKPGEFVFKPQDIHIWTIPLDQPAETLHFLSSLLSQDETTRAAKLRIQQPQDRFISGRGWLRLILCRYTGGEPEDLLFEYGINGKPHLSRMPGKADRCSLPSFNLTHSNGTSLVAVTPSAQIGIDLEWIHPIPEIDAIARQYFSKRECADLLSRPEKDKTLIFYQIWTKKEAYIKALGAGFSLPLNSFSVDLTGRKIILEADCNNPANQSIPDPDWQLIPIQAPDNFSAALVLEKMED